MPTHLLTARTLRLVHVVVETAVCTVLSARVLSGSSVWRRLVPGCSDRAELSRRRYGAAGEGVWLPRGAPRRGARAHFPRMAGRWSADCL